MITRDVHGGHLAGNMGRGGGSNLRMPADDKGEGWASFVRNCFVKAITKEWAMLVGTSDEIKGKYVGWYFGEVNEKHVTNLG